MESGELDHSTESLGCIYNGYHDPLSLETKM